VALSASQVLLYEQGTPISQLNIGTATFIPDMDYPNNSRAARTYSGALTASAHPRDSLSLTANYQGLATHRNNKYVTGNEVYNYDGLIHTASGRADWQVGKYHSINAGYEFENENYHTRTIEPIENNANSTEDVTQRYHAIFVQDQLHLFDRRLQLAGSYRVQFFNLSSPSFLPASGTPYSGVKLSNPPTSNTWDVSSAYLFRQTGTKLRAHVGTGYRAPSLYERFGSGFFYG
jgi:outer membrane cobalamin receptor